MNHNTPPIRMIGCPGARGKPRGTLATVYAPNALHAARRFEHVQEMMLRGDIDFENSSTRLAAYLVSFDGIVTRTNLVNALAAFRTAYIWNDAVCIDWENACGRVDRRHLSVWTRFALAQPEALLHPPEQTVRMLDQFLKQHLTDQKLSTNLDEFLADGHAWLSLNLPGPWFSHAIDAFRLAALPRSVFARESSRKALCANAAAGQRDTNPIADSAIGLALDAYFDWEGIDGGYWLVDEVMARVPANATRRNMVDDLLCVAAKDGKGKTSSLILAWAIDLAESGTQDDKDISPRTVSKYIRAISRDLLSEFRGKSLEQLESRDFDAIYRQIINSKTPGTKHTCASAISSWHLFLVCWLDVAPRRQSLYRDFPTPIPKANILWPHEMSTIARWLAQAEESRLNQQTHVAFAIANAIRIRTNELAKLRLKNVRLTDGSVEIEICTSTIDGGLKSANARRAQTIECPVTAELVRSWKLRRQEELAFPDDYLFGDPHRAGKPYRLGQMRALMNRLLKDATGDHTVSIHTLSHSWATCKFMNASLHESIADINIFDALSAAAGHSDASMTFEHYVHRFEEAIRKWIDTALTGRLRWPEMSHFVSMSHGTYRQRLSRQSRSMSDIDEGQCKLEFVRAAFPALELPAAHDGMETVEAMTIALRARDTSTSLGLVIDVLTDVSLGLTTDVIALRACRTADEIACIIHQAIDVLVELDEFDWGSFARVSADIAGTLREALHDTARRRIDFTKIKQKKIEALRQVLAKEVNDGSLRKFSLAWLQCYRFGYLSLDHPSLAAPLVHLLKKAGTPSSAIGIFHIPMPDQSGGRLQEDIDAIFIQEFAAMPLKKECSVRGGRPRAYFAIAGADFTTNASSATLCMKGFNATLLSACVLERLSSKHPRSDK